MSQIIIGESFSNIIASFFNANVFYYAIAGIFIISGIKKIFQDVGIEICIGYYSRGFHKSLYLLQACLIFILLETNMAMSATHSNIETIPFILNLNAILLAAAGIFIMTNFILITPIVKSIIKRNTRDLQPKIYRSFSVVSSSLSLLLAIFGFFTISYENSYAASIQSASISSDWPDLSLYTLATAIIMTILITISTIYTTRFLSTYKERQIEEARLMSMEDIHELEENADQILILTEKLTFESKSECWDELKNVVKKNMQRYVVAIHANNCPDPEPIYKFVIRKGGDIEETKEKTREQYLDGHGQSKDFIDKYMESNVGEIDSEYFDLLRPFPERTYINKSGSFQCDIIRSKTGHFHILGYEKNKSDPEIKMFLKAFDSFIPKSTQANPYPNPQIESYL